MGFSWSSVKRKKEMLWNIDIGVLVFLQIEVLDVRAKTDHQITNFILIFYIIIIWKNYYWKSFCIILQYSVGSS